MVYWFSQYSSLLVPLEETGDIVPVSLRQYRFCTENVYTALRYTFFCLSTELPVGKKDSSNTNVGMHLHSNCFNVSRIVGTSCKVR